MKIKQNNMSDHAGASNESEVEADFSSEENKPTEPPKEEKPLNMSPGAQKLRGWLNKSLKVQMFDGRILVGVFLCSDRDANVILGSCTEYLPNEEEEEEEPRMLGLVMVPGKHIKNVWIDQDENNVAGMPSNWTAYPKIDSNNIT